MEKESDLIRVQTKGNEGKYVNVKYSRFKRQIFRRVWPIRIFLISIFIACIFLLSWVLVNLSKSIGIGTAVTFAESFIFPSNDVLQSKDGRIGILVLGVGGKGHEGSLLTDSMLRVSVPTSQGKIVIVSIPRDIWIPEIRAKINSAYYWGSQQEIGGMGLSKSVAAQVLGSKPEYGVVVDFSGFKNIVDSLGGIEVSVENGFTDNLYPIAGKENDQCGGDPLFMCRYETITFDKGLQKMNGETALKYVRSRHSEDDQGTDTSRQLRQQAVISAIKSKVLSTEIIFNPKRAFLVWEAVKSSVETDMDVNTLAIVARKIYDSRNSVGSYLIPEELLTNPPISPLYDKQYVFIPKAGNGNWSQINNWVRSLAN